MIIQVTMWNTENEEIKLILNGNKGWTTEGNVKLTPRVIWFMNTLQEICKEFRVKDSIFR